MFKTIIENYVEYRFKFTHLDFDKADLFIDLLHVPLAQIKLCSHRTTCTISVIDLPTNKVLAERTAHVYCSKKDIYTRKTGRKLAMAKAFETIKELDNNMISKETRKLIWDEYFKWCRQ